MKFFRKDSVEMLLLIIISGSGGFLVGFNFGFNVLSIITSLLLGFVVGTYWHDFYVSILNYFDKSTGCEAK